MTSASVRKFEKYLHIKHELWAWDPLLAKNPAWNVGMVGE